MNVLTDTRTGTTVSTDRFAKQIGVSETALNQYVAENFTVASQVKFGRGTMRVYVVSDLMQHVEAIRARSDKFREQVRAANTARLPDARKSSSKSTTTLDEINRKLDALIAAFGVQLPAANGHDSDA